MIYRGPGLLSCGRMIRLHARPFPTPLTLQKIVSLSQATGPAYGLEMGGRGRAWSRIIYDRKKDGASINRSILSVTLSHEINKKYCRTGRKCRHLKNGSFSFYFPYQMLLVPVSLLCRFHSKCSSIF
jgi:hypothetical protein